MGSFDERSFNLAQRLRQNGRLAALPLSDFKRMARKQGFLMLIDADRALATLPDLLEGVSLEERRHAWQFVVDLLTVAMGAECLDSEKFELMAKRFGVDWVPGDKASTLVTESMSELAPAPVPAPVVESEPVPVPAPVTAPVSAAELPVAETLAAEDAPASEPAPQVFAPVAAVAPDVAPISAAAAAATSTKAGGPGSPAKQTRSSRPARGRSARTRRRPVQGDLYDAGGSDN